MRSWLRRGLFALSLTGLPLSALALSRLGRIGGLMLQAACSLLFGRAIQFVVTGAPARLGRIPHYLAFAELAAGGLASITGFWAWVWQPFGAPRFGMQQRAYVAARVAWVSKLAVAAIFVLHSVRMAIYLNSGQGWRGEVAERKPSRRHGLSAAEEIAPGVHWLEVGRGVTRSNVYFVRSGSSWVLIDTASANCGQLIRQAADSLFGDKTPPAAILLTHSHPDHAGSARELARLWDCPVYLHADELPLVVDLDLSMVKRYANPLDRWIILPILRLMPRRRVEAMFAKTGLEDLVQAFDSDDMVPDLPEWSCIPTPGHTPGHVSFFRSSDRVLIASDAVSTVDLNSAWGFLLWALRRNTRRVSGPPWYSTWNWRLAQESVARLARLEPRVLACGHGHPITGEQTARDLHALAGRYRDAAAERRAAGRL